MALWEHQLLCPVAIMKCLVASLLLLALPAAAQLFVPNEQRFTLTPSISADVTSYVFYVGTNAGVYYRRVAFTNLTWAQATNELTIGLAKTNLFPGVTNYVTATAAKLHGTNFVESIPAVEINFVPPLPPVLRIEVLESSSINGPWRSVTNFALPTPVNRPEQYFAARLRL